MTHKVLDHVERIPVYSVRFSCKTPWDIDQGDTVLLTCYKESDERPITFAEIDQVHKKSVFEVVASGTVVTDRFKKDGIKAGDEVEVYLIRYDRISTVSILVNEKVLV